MPMRLRFSNSGAWSRLSVAMMTLALGGCDGGFVPPPHLFIAANLDHDGGPDNNYDPENGYKDIYKKIWGK